MGKVCINVGFRVEDEELSYIYERDRCDAPAVINLH